MIQQLRSLLLPLILTAFVLVEGCGHAFDNLERRTFTPSSFNASSDSASTALQKASPYIKLHMKDGTLALFDAWARDREAHIIDGTGVIYSAKRDTIESGRLAIGLDSVLIIETNELSYSNTESALTIFTYVVGAVAAFCIVSPKTCFGSCPTFYVSDIDTLRPRAEGFSASIAPSLEATDCDALGDVPLDTRHVTIEMRNEALETHVVRSVNLLAVPKHEGASIYKDNKGSYRECYGLRPPVRAVAEEGDCLGAIAAADNRERMRHADSTDLAAKETIELEFENVPGDTSGIVIGCRQSLMTTFLFYKTLGFMGKDVGQWFAEMERSGANEPMDALESLLGGIDVFVADSADGWRKIGSVLEYGPLATDIHLVPLPPSPDRTVRVRLELTKGYWRIDNVNLTRIAGAVEPLRISPASVSRDGVIDVVARHVLADPAKTLVTKPGDSYAMRFDLPDSAKDFGLFLESRGYYLEWMRESWMTEENPLALGEILFDPASALRRLAPEYARTERAVEAQFWRSKYAR